MKIGYARVSTEEQDLTIQREHLQRLGVSGENIYTDHGISGGSRAERSGLTTALAVVRKGDELVVTKLDRLGRSIRDLQDIAADLDTRGVKLNIGGQLHDPGDAFGRLFFNLLAMFAEFERDMIRQRTREGMARARELGHLRGRAPKLSPVNRSRLRSLHRTGGYSISALAEMFGVGRATVYRTLDRDD